MNIFGKRIAKDTLPLMVAELSCNHEGSLDKMRSLMYKAREASADAVKIQVYDANDMTVDNYKIEGGPWDGRSLYDLYKKNAINYDWLPTLFSYAKDLEIPLFASVFSEKGLNALEEVNCPAYKIASFELNDIYLIRKVAKTNKPVILSAGMADLDEIDKACTFLDPFNSALLHCVSAYPTPINETNLWKIPLYMSMFSSIVGFSDHTTGIRVGPLAVAAGARIIEKHMGDGSKTSDDEAFSITPHVFKHYAYLCRQAAEASFKATTSEGASLLLRRSVYAVKDIQEGEAFTPENIKCLRPSFGICASRYPQVLCRRAAREIKAGTPLKQEHVS